MCYHLSYLIKLLLWFLVSAGVQLSSDHGPEMDICPGTNVTFTCTAPVSVTIQWNYNGITAAVTEHSTGTRIMGPFTVQVIAKDMSSFSSTAVATITAEVRGDLTCKNRESSTDAKSIAIPELKGEGSCSTIYTMWQSSTDIFSTGSLLFNSILCGNISITKHGNYVTVRLSGGNMKLVYVFVYNSGENYVYA